MTTKAWIISGPDADPAQEQYPLMRHRVEEYVREYAGRPFREPDIKIHEVYLVSGQVWDVTEAWFDFLFADERAEAEAERRAEEPATRADTARDEVQS